MFDVLIFVQQSFQLTPALLKLCQPGIVYCTYEVSRTVMGPPNNIHQLH